MEAITVIGLIGTIMSIVLSLIAFKRSERKEEREEGLQEGTIKTDIGYIKAGIDRMEKNLIVIDERYRTIVERIAKLEEGLKNT